MGGEGGEKRGVERRRGVGRLSNLFLTLVKFDKNRKVIKNNKYIRGEGEGIFFVVTRSKAMSSVLRLISRVGVARARRMSIRRSWSTLEWFFLMSRRRSNTIIFTLLSLSLHKRLM